LSHAITTLRDNNRGPWCRTGEDVIAWLKTI
jgi:hypothetical protein